MADILSIYFHVKSKLENNPELSQAFYHGWMHTKNVYDAVCYLAVLENVDDDDTELLKVATLYHDTGYTTGNSVGHEHISANIAREELPSLFGFSQDEVDMVCILIEYTAIDKKPLNILHKIMRDADMEYLGRDCYPYVSELLRRENSVLHAVWRREQLSFLKKHYFLTSSARLLFDNQKAINLKKLETQEIGNSGE